MNIRDHILRGHYPTEHPDGGRQIVRTKGGYGAIIIATDSGPSRNRIAYLLPDTGSICEADEDGANTLSNSHTNLMPPTPRKNIYECSIIRDNSRLEGWRLLRVELKGEAPWPDEISFVLEMEKPWEEPK